MSPSSSLIVNPLLVGSPILLRPSVVVEDNGVDDDFACPLVRALQPTGLAAQADVCTGRWMVPMQGQSKRHQTADRKYESIDQAMERLYKSRKRSGDKADERISGKK